MDETPLLSVDWFAVVLVYSSVDWFTALLRMKDKRRFGSD
jgi:hypothetical protein